MIKKLAYLAVIVGAAAACDLFEEAKQEPENEPRLTLEFLQYNEVNKVAVKVWYGADIDLTYYSQTGDVDSTAVLTIYDLWTIRFFDKGPNMEEFTYVHTDAEGTLGKLIPGWGSYELSPDGKKITFGPIRDNPFGDSDPNFEAIFDVSFNEALAFDSRDDRLDLSREVSLPGGRKVRESIRLGTRMW